VRATSEHDRVPPTERTPCRCCGKPLVRYPSRRIARQIAKRRAAGQHLSAYPCGTAWHLGHLPPAVLYGIATRSEVYGRG